MPGAGCLLRLKSSVETAYPFDGLLDGMVVQMGMKRWYPHSISLRAVASIGLMLLLLAIAPFAVAQDVHHELAAADHDGHEHSDTDLCQWVQHHTAGSLDIGAPLLTACELIDLLELPSDSVLLSFELPTPGPSRAPPLG